MLAEGGGLVYLHPTIYPLGGVPITVSGGDVTLEGLGGEQGATLDAEGLSRAIDASGGGHLTLRRIHIVNGVAESGGGLLVQGSSLLMEEASVRNCAATGPLGFTYGGGGLAVRAATAMLVNSLVADCVASDSCGGGIWVDEANVTLQDGSRIERCTSLRGGGVLAYKGEIALESSSVSECHAPIYGSALHLQHGSQVPPFALTAQLRTRAREKRVRVAILACRYAADALLQMSLSSLFNCSCGYVATVMVVAGLFGEPDLRGVVRATNSVRYAAQTTRSIFARHDHHPVVVADH